MRKSLAFAALLSLAAFCVQPVQATTAKPAPVSALVKAVNIPYTQFTLANGLRVIVHTDRKAPVVAISVWYDVGSKHEPKGKTGFVAGEEGVQELVEAVDQPLPFAEDAAAIFGRF